MVHRFVSLIFLAFLRVLFRLRYKITVKGDKALSALDKGVLFLPNHPAETDPLILMALLWNKYAPIPLVIEHFYYKGGLRFFMDFVGAMPLPLIEIGNSWTVAQVEKRKKSVIEGLKNGKNFLIYPAGKLKRGAYESLGGASFAYDVVRACPEVSVVLVRTTGLWGSIFSCAFTGSTPSFFDCVKQSVRAVLKNGIFFLPKRHITIELALAPSDMPVGGTKLEFNRYLESWYNQYPEKGPEPLSLVSYSFWKHDVPTPYVPVEKPVIPIGDIDQKLKKEVIQEIGRFSACSVDQMHTQMSLTQDLGLDSLDLAQLQFFLEERYQIDGLHFGQLQTVADVLQAAAGKKEKERLKEAPLADTVEWQWPEEEKRKPVATMEAETIIEAFIRSCLRQPSAIGAVDAVSGMRSYRKLLTAVFVLASRIKHFPGERVGVLLPSSVGAYLSILAILAAGKVPVMLNWTVGRRYLQHMVEVTGVQKVISSMRFLSRVEGAEVDVLDDYLVPLEDLRREISPFRKISSLLQTFLPISSLKALYSKGQGSDTAVILFTSGTETLPKAVPLSHKNILSNQKSGLDCVRLQSHDILYAVLPPFHSFGFSVTGLFPLLIGVRVCYAPDPTDTHGMARDIAHWKPSLFCSAPSFIRLLLGMAHPKDLESIRLYVTGAEKAPEEMFEKVEQLGATLIEGYGISECAPIVTMTRIGEKRRGVGKPLSGISLLVISEQHDILPLGQEGEICISGPNVFHGYLDPPETHKSPFFIWDNKRWYRSGDRGYVDPEGNLIITGRLKRFIKVGGEMINLAEIEQELIRLCPEKNWIIPVDKPPLAVIAKGKESERIELILFVTFPVTREEVNQALKAEGFGRLIKFSQIKQLDEIPLTGTGKTHYRFLEEII